MRRLVMAAVATLGAALLYSAAIAAPVNITQFTDPVVVQDLGITAMNLTAGQTGRSSIVDVANLDDIVLLISWDPADSNAVAFGLTLFNKEDGTWGTTDTPLHLPFFQTLAAPPAATDTTGTLSYWTQGNAAHPTLYVARVGTTPVASTYSLTALARTPRVIPGAAGVAINIGRLAGSWKNFGLQITNCNAAALGPIRAVLLVR